MSNFQIYTINKSMLMWLGLKKRSSFPITRPSPEKPSESKLSIVFSDQNVFFLSGFQPSL